MNHQIRVNVPDLAACLKQGAAQASERDSSPVRMAISEIYERLSACEQESVALENRMSDALFYRVVGGSESMTGPSQAKDSESFLVEELNRISSRLGSLQEKLSSLKNNCQL